MKKFVITAFLSIVACTLSNHLAAENYYAEIIKVSAGKSPLGSGYTISMTVKSSDKNCSHYVNWLEAVSEDGELLYRRILGHPHSKEQPFSRGGITELINDETVFYARAHIHPYGYSNKGMKGSIKTGFSAVEIPIGFFAKQLENKSESSSHCNANIE